MKKVIIKCKLNNRDSFESKLEATDLDFSPIYWQHDRVYVPRGYKKGMNYPRLVLRTEMRALDEPARYSMILRRHIEDSGIDIVEETPVVDYSSAANIILQLGFKPTGETSRRRQELSTNENTKIYLDSIDGKDASYAKIEASLKDGDSVTEVRKSLLETMQSFGESTVVDSAYFELQD